MISARLMQDTRDTEEEFGDLDLKRMTVISSHLIVTAHVAHGRGQRGATPILKGFPGFQDGLLADHPQAANLLHLLQGICDEPVARDELRCNRAAILDGDGIGEDIAVICFVGLLGQVIYLRRHGNMISAGFGHGRVCSTLLAGMATRWALMSLLKVELLVYLQGENHVD